MLASDDSIWANRVASRAVRAHAFCQPPQRGGNESPAPADMTLHLIDSVVPVVCESRHSRTTSLHCHWFARRALWTLNDQLPRFDNLAPETPTPLVPPRTAGMPSGVGGGVGVRDNSV